MASPTRRILALILAIGAVTAAATVPGSTAGAATAGGTAERDTTPPTRTLLWSDEFNASGRTSPDAADWQLMTGGGGWGNNELEAYTARMHNAVETDGRLRIIARREDYTGADGISRWYTSARLMGRHEFKYGYLVARMKIPSGAGLWPAFWTLGADIRTGTQWPATGEIDVMEAINDMSFVSGALHGTDANAEYSWQAYSIANRTSPPTGWTDRWHRFGISWSARSITWYLDGRAYASVRRGDLAPGQVWEFTKAQVPLLNLAVGGNWPGWPDDSTHFPAVMKIDYVRLFDHR